MAYQLDDLKDIVRRTKEEFREILEDGSSKAVRGIFKDGIGFIAFIDRKAGVPRELL